MQRCRTDSGRAADLASRERLLADVPWASERGGPQEAQYQIPDLAQFVQNLATVSVNEAAVREDRLNYHE